MKENIKVKIAKDGKEILVVVKDHTEYRLNSVYRPIAEAEKFAKQFERLETGSLFFVFGFGNGMFAKEILKICKERVTVVFYEPCSAITEYVNTRIDLNEFCREHNCFLVADGIDEKLCSNRVVSVREFDDVVKRIITYNNRDKIFYVTLPKYKELFPKEYERFVKTMEQRRDELIVDINTARESGHIAVTNNIRLLSYIPKSYCLNNFVGIFPEDMPAIIVSAGPSLEKNIHLLHQAKGRALILCVDAAVKYMLKKNILPDLLVTADPRKEISLFDDEKIQKIPMVAYSSLNSKVLEKVKPDKFILGGISNSYIREIYEKRGYLWHDVDFGGSVATMACAVCRELGFKKVILVGQDLALKENQMYAGKEKVTLNSVGRELVSVEAIDGSIVQTPTDYYMYIKWFERFIDKYPEIHVTDATEGGARIAGSEILSLDEALRRYAVAEYDVQGIIDSVAPAFTPEQQIQLVEEFQKEKDIYDDIIQKMKRGVILAQRGIKLSLRKNQGGSTQYDKINDEMTELCEICDRLSEFALIRGEIDAVDLDSFAGVFDPERYGLSVREQYQKMEKFFSCMLEGAKSVRQIFDETEF